MGGDRKTGKRYPHVWITGPDPLKHEIYENFLKAKAQANFRQEGWEFDFEDFFKMWKKDWHNRGRHAENVCMTRHDNEKPWSRANAYILTRKEHLKLQGLARKQQGMRYKKMKIQ